MAIDTRLRRVLLGALLAAVLPFAPIAMAVEPDAVTYVEAMRLIRNGKDAEAIAALERLAGLGESRAQYVLGLAYIEGKIVQRDFARGYAWLQVAATYYNPSIKHGAADDAYRAALEVGHQLPGTDLIKAERITATLLDDIRQRQEADKERATLALTSPDGTAVNAWSGCAAEPAMQGCAPTPGLPDKPDRCTGVLVTPDTPPTTIGPATRILQPEYPSEARRRIEDGSVIFMAYVDRSGYICRVTLARGSGVRTIDWAATEAVRRWRLSPGLRDGAPVEVLHTFAVSFRLEGLDFD